MSQPARLTHRLRQSLPAHLSRSAALASVSLASLLLSGCSDLYSRQAQWPLPKAWGHHQLVARMNVGLFMWNVDVSVDDQPILSGESWFWSHSIDLSGQYAGLPITAHCDKDQHACDIGLAGLNVAKVHI